MRKFQVKMSMLVLAFCVALSAAFMGTVVANAEGEPNTLTVVSTNSTDARFVEDVKKADVVVDVYRVADAVKDGTYDTYNYVNWDKAFADLQTRFDEISANRDSTASDWQTLYEDMAKLAPSATPVVAAEKVVDGQVEVDLNDGLYLVMAHGTKAKDAYSETYAYTFPPTMVSLPTKINIQDGSMTNPIYTDWTSGEWLTEATIMLKSSRVPLFGKLVINKEVEDFSGEKATFVFEITGTNAFGGELDTMYAAITYPDQVSTEITGILAGSTVTVTETEIYTGARYQHVSGDGSTALIVADELVDETHPVATVYFVNKPDGDNVPGHGVENHFAYNSETGDWDFTPRPSQVQ